MRPTRATAILLWVILIALAALVAARARYTADLSAFLPRSPSPAQRLLVQQLREGIASRLILAGIEGATPADRARASLELGRRLRATGLFVSVSNGEPVGLDRDRAVLFGNRYLLSPQVTAERFSVAGLHAALSDSIDLLASPAGLLAKSLLPRDPTGEMLAVLDELGEDHRPASTNGAWTSRDGQRALLVAQTRAAGSDTDGQELAVRTIRREFGSTPGSRGLRLEMSGPGVFSVAARATIKHEVLRLSILSTVLILLLLLIVYRSPRAVLLGFIPVASGALAGVAAVALGFGLVHGITLGFGVTLIGESVDYSIYLFIQSRHNPGGSRQQLGGGSRQQLGDSSWQRNLWPTIRLGVLTSIAGFASLLPSGFPGLAQLGLYSIAGLVTAALVTRWVLPELLPQNLHIRDTTPLGVAAAKALRRLHAPRLWLILVPILSGVVLYLHRDTVWNRELTALSPVSAHDQALDSRLRSDLGAPDPRYLIVVSGHDQESALQSAERVGRRLDPLAQDGSIDGYDSPTRYLPSQATQRARQAAIPATTELRERLQQALVGLPLRAERLEPFLQDAEAARTQALLTHDTLAGTSLATGVDALLLRDGERWSALLPLRVSDAFASAISRVQSTVSEAAPGDAVVLDIKGEADRLYSSYLSEVVRLSMAGFVAILVLLIAALRSVTRTVRVVAPLVLAVLTVAAGLVLLGHQLTILHLIGMLLIVAVGSNYALFFDRRSAEGHAGAVALTLASLLLANAATVVGFGVLAFSTVPVLSAMGSTVAPGALLALIFAALLAGDLPDTARA
ncbi:MAG TPA: MMPL family transporter [Steroidobacteraceae bacterium]|nr:MMPL family transporter [Steroidobacteraceae bacterium]